MERFARCIAWVSLGEAWPHLGLGALALEDGRAPDLQVTASCPLPAGWQGKRVLGKMPSALPTPACYTQPSSPVGPP
jgi:hypothetical protein